MSESPQAASLDLEILAPSDDNPVDPNKLERDGLGRPRIRVECPNAVPVEGTMTAALLACRDGRIPSTKRPGSTVQCPKCKGRGYKLEAYTRCTTFVGVLDDRSALEKWQKRIVLKGLAADTELITAVSFVQPDAPDDVLNDLANRAFEAGDGYEKARKGTDLHKLSEFVDSGQPLPAELWNDDAQAWRPVTLQDRADMAAYVRVRDHLGLVYLDRELFVVQDGYSIGGTFDGLATLVGEQQCQCGKPMIVDLKTGRTDYGQGKMGQQLAVYAHGSRYDPATGERTPLDACPHVGIIIALPQGTGEATWLLLDLERGWQTVSLSQQVRDYRREVGRGSFVIGSGEVA